MQVSEIMTKDVKLADPGSVLRDVVNWMRAENVGAFPVGEGDRLAGMITDRDIAVRGVGAERPAENMTVRSAMSEDVYYCFADEDLGAAGEKMANHQVHRLPVLNRDKRLVGIVALADLARAGEEGKDAAIAAISGIADPTMVARR